MTDTLPALRSLGSLADLCPVLIVDSREQDPLRFTRFPSIRGTLSTGDYSVCGVEHLFAVERKSIADLVGCCMGESRERFERELHRLRGYRFKRLLMVGTVQEIERGNYRSNIRPASVLASLSAWEVRYDVPPVFADTPGAAAALVEGWAWWYCREAIEGVNRLSRGIHAAKGTAMSERVEPNHEPQEKGTP